MAYTTYADIKDAFFQATGDSEGTNAFFSNAYVERLANTALRKIARAANYYDAIDTGTTSAGTATISATSSYQVWRVEVDDEALYPITKKELRQRDRRWLDQSGRPRYYYLDESLAGETPTVGMFPNPGAAYSYKIFGFGRPIDCDDDNDSNLVHIPLWAINTVLYSMLADAYAADSYVRNDELASFWRAVYEDHLSRVKMRANEKIPKYWAVEADSRPQYLYLGDNLPELVPEP